MKVKCKYDKQSALSYSYKPFVYIRIFHPVRAKKKPVSIPKRKNTTKPIPKILLQRGRKSQQNITNDFKKNYQIQPQRYVPTKPRDKQINELQYIMETGNKPYQIPSNQYLTNKTKSKSKSQSLPVQPQTVKLQSRMEEILTEIHERQQFLFQMKQLNSQNYHQYKLEINHQISLKSKEFMQLDMKLQNLKI